MADVCQASAPALAAGAPRGDSPRSASSAEVVDACQASCDFAASVPSAFSPDAYGIHV